MLNEWIMLNRYFPIYKKENYGFRKCETLCRLKLRKKINVHIVLAADPKSFPGSDIQDIPMVLEYYDILKFFFLQRKNS